MNRNRAEKDRRRKIVEKEWAFEYRLLFNLLVCRVRTLEKVIPIGPERRNISL